MEILLKNGEIIDLIGYGITNIPENFIKVNLLFKRDFDYKKLIGNGFKLYDEYDGSGAEQDFTDCVYQYNIHNPIEHGIIMTNKKDYHDKPKRPLTIEQKIQLLDNLKKEKLEQLSEQCQRHILNGVDIEIDGIIEHFSYSLTDQNNIDDLFNLAISTNVPQPYHCDGGSCKLYGVENIKQLYMSQKLNKIHHTTYFNQLKLWVLSLETEEEIENVEYGQELIGEYLDTYNKMMEQSTSVIKSLIS